MKIHWNHPELGGDYLLINGHDRKDEGAIATQEQWDNFEDSTAHLGEDGNIRRYHKIVGDISQITFLE